MISDVGPEDSDDNNDEEMKKYKKEGKDKKKPMEEAQNFDGRMKFTKESDLKDYTENN